MEANCIPVISPYIPEIVDKVVILIIALHLLQQVSITDVELLQYGL